MAQRALEEVHGIAASEEDISFVFEKLEAGKPELLRGVPAGIVEPPVLWPCSASCNRCKQPLGAHRRPVKVTFLSSDSGKSQGVAMEMRCDVCASYFLGPWSYMRHDRRCGPAISDLSLLGAPDACATFVLPTPGLAAAYACSVQDLKLISGTLHHARGSFQAASEVFADRSGCEDLRDDTHAHEILESLWYAWALHRFLGQDLAGGLDWCGFWDGQCSEDQWLLHRKSLLRTCFVTEWAIRHVESCKVCHHLFAVGLDGKRGMKRFLCASLDGTPLHVPEVDAWLVQGCGHKPAIGSLYCHAHDFIAEEQAEADDPDAEEVDQVLQHRSTESGTIQYLVQQPVPGGTPVCRWLPSSEVAQSLRRHYEVGRLAAKPGRRREGKIRRQRARVGAHTLPQEPHVLGEDAADKGQCDIDKSTQAWSSNKYRRRRLGGVIAAISGCRVALDWDEHQFGEGSAQIYIVLARLVADIMRSIDADNSGRLPKTVFMDNACALWKFAQNPKRAQRTQVTRFLEGLHYMLDVWHACNHSKCLEDPARAARLDPRHEANKDLRHLINTEACEQFFSFLDSHLCGYEHGPWPLLCFHVLDPGPRERQGGQEARLVTR